MRLKAVGDDGVGQASGGAGVRRARHALVGVAAVFLVVVPVAWSLATAPAAWAPSSDTATLLLRAADALDGDLPLVGMPTTLGDAPDERLHHPGPAELWLLALPATAGGNAPLVAVAAVSCASVAGIALWLRRTRRAGPVLVIATFVALTLWTLRGCVLVDPFNPYAGLLPFGAYLAATVGVAERHRWAGFAAVVSGSYAAQAHVAYFGVVGGITMLVVLGHARRVVTSWRGRGLGGPLASPPFVASAVAGIALWAPVLLDQARGNGNLLKLLGASSDGDTLGLVRAMAAVAHALGPPPVWLSGSPSAPALLETASSMTNVVAVAVVAGLVLIVLRRPTIALAHAALVCLAAVAVGLVLVSRTPRTLSSEAGLHNYLWLVPVSTLAWIVVGATAARVLPRRAWVAPVVLAALALAAVALVPRDAAVPTWPRSAQVVAEIGDTAADVLRKDDRYLMEISDDLDEAAIALGLLFALDEDGFEVVVPRLNRPGFSRLHRGDAEAVLVVRAAIGAPPPAEPGATVVTSRAPSPRAVARLADARDALRRHVDQAGGMRVEGRPLSTAEIDEVIQSDAIPNLERFGLITAPDIPRRLVVDLERAHAGDVAHVTVFVLPRDARPELLAAPVQA